jgi:AzlC protein
MNPPVTFTRAGLAAGARRTLPIALGDFAFGIVFGVVAGLSLSESVLMSGLVFAGAAQFIAIGLWTAPLPIVSLIATTLLCSRHSPDYGAISPAALAVSKLGDVPPCAGVAARLNRCGIRPARRAKTGAPARDQQPCVSDGTHSIGLPGVLSAGMSRAT